MTVRVIQLTNPDIKQQLLLIATTINEMLNGRDNSVGTFTLSAGVTSTTVTDNLFNSDMAPLWTPTTSNAAGALSGMYVSSRANGQFVITHANTATTDRTFLYVRRG